MCGIYGIVSQKNNALNTVLNGLKRLEYRGYDSAGIAVQTSGGSFKVFKKQGKIDVLENVLNHQKGSFKTAIGHNRWATHGKPSGQNSHPHLSNCKNFCVVHNGIIENYAEIKDFLISQGYKFASETDTEVIPNLISHHFKKTNNVKKAISLTLKKLKGSFALAILSSLEQNKIYCVRSVSPLVVQKTNGGSFIVSSDIQALNEQGQIFVLADCEIAVLSAHEIEFFNFNFEKVNKEEFKQTFTISETSLGKHKFFMEKEIAEAATACSETLKNFKAPEIDFNGKKIFFIACGTAYHACLVAKLFLQANGVDSVCEIASEFNFFPQVFNKNSVFVFVSQSGETADTLKALEIAKEKGAKIISIVNVEGSRLALSSDICLKTRAGKEQGVAATKSFCAQLACLYALCCTILKKPLTALKSLPEIMAKQLKTKISKKIIKKTAQCENVYFIGKGFDLACAHEASLKLKEISYIHCSSIGSGELKHGSLATISNKSVVFAIATDHTVLSKIKSGICETFSRGAYVVVVSNINKSEFENFNEFIKIENVPPNLSPIISVIAMQKLALEVSIEKGLNPDKPRNLAKSVTVE